MKLITKDTDYAIRALVFMGEKEKNIFNVRNLSEELKISHQFLRRLLQVLSKNRILRSVKGKGGGFSLNKKPGEIFLSELVGIFQVKMELKNCMVKDERCPNFQSCLLSRKLDRIEQIIEKEIGNLSIENLIGKKVDAKNR